MNGTKGQYLIVRQTTFPKILSIYQVRAFILKFTNHFKREYFGITIRKLQYNNKTQLKNNISMAR